MFLTFENVAYFLSTLGLFFWINNSVIPIEQRYLQEEFGDEYSRYLQAVKKWMFF
jgi:protein-S-isoprenylcysteine O-methyltransferase Ste14